VIHGFHLSSLFVLLALRHIHQTWVQDVLLLVVEAFASNSGVAEVSLVWCGGLAVAAEVAFWAFCLLLWGQLMLFTASRPVLGVRDVRFHLLGHG
jgi:hypothetical protein